MNKKLAIVGAGGHGKVVGEIATLSKYKIIDFNFKGEKTNKTIVKSTQMLPDTKEKAVMFEDFIEDDNFIQSDITPK